MAFKLNDRVKESSATFSAAFGAIYNDTNSDKLCVPDINSPLKENGTTFAIYLSP